MFRYKLITHLKSLRTLVPGFKEFGSSSMTHSSLFQMKKNKFLRGLIRGTSFEKVKNMIQNLKRRLDCNSVKVKSIYIDNCCQWRTLLQNIFGDEVCVKLDLFCTLCGRE